MNNYIVALVFLLIISPIGFLYWKGRKRLRTMKEEDRNRKEFYRRVNEALRTAVDDPDRIELFVMAGMLEQNVLAQKALWRSMAGPIFGFALSSMLLLIGGAVAIEDLRDMIPLLLAVLWVFTGVAMHAYGCEIDSATEELEERAIPQYQQLNQIISGRDKNRKAGVLD